MISVHDVTSIYRVPILLHEQKGTKIIREKLHLPKYVQSKLVLKKWRQLAVKSERNTREVTIALVGKYVAFEDAYVSVVKGERSQRPRKSKLRIFSTEAFGTCSQSQIGSQVH